MPRHGLKKRDGLEQGAECGELVIRERMRFLVGDNARSDGDGGVRDGAYVMRARSKHSFEVFEKNARRHGHDHFARKLLAQRSEDVFYQIGFYRYDDQIARGHDVLGAFAGEHADSPRILL